MTPKRWKEIDELVQAALEHRAEDRSAFLDQACRHDEELRREVASLVSYEPQASAFLKHPAFDGSGEMAIEDQHHLVEGSTLGRYRIGRLIGVGGMGEVYLAEDTELERTVALKVLPVELAADRERMRRFVQEAKSVSNLNHPNIITIHEIGRFDGTHFIAIEYVKGQTLREHLKRGRLHFTETLEIALQIAAALSAAHEAGIVHRDIKPENVMRRDDGLVKVLDFGLAKLIAQRREHLDSEASTRVQVQTTPGMILGTVAYMSPEQACGKSVDARTDIFSLGVVWYEMLTGRVPFAGETTSDVLAAILKDEPTPLAEYVSEIPKGLERIVNKSLKKNPEERYQHVTDLLVDLRDLKQELEFVAKLERTAAPAKNDNATAGKAAADSKIQNAQTTSSAEYIVSEIKQHKRGFMAVLASLLLAASGLGYWLYANRSAATDRNQIESIAVLPFQNLSGNSDIEYLSDGISETLINSLTELQHLKVIARSTAFRYKGREVDPQAVGRDLNVRAVLMGRVRQTGDTLNVQVDLVDASTGAQLWGEEYERKVSDVLSVKQAIAREVTDKLRLQLTREEKQTLAKSYSENTEAYQAYLKGRYFWNKRTEEGLKRAIGYFNQAIVEDPNYALAYGGLADCYKVLGRYGWLAPEESFPKAREAVTKALAIDNQLAEIHSSLATIMLSYDYLDQVGAEREFNRAIELNPNYPTAHQWYAEYLSPAGRHQEALAEIKRAQELDPLSPIINAGVAGVLYRARQYDQAIEQSRKALEIDPNFVNANRVLSAAYQAQGRYEEAIALLQEVLKSSPDQRECLGELGYAYAMTGKRTEAQKIIEHLQELSKRRYGLSYHVALVYTGLGEKDRALGWLQKAYDERSMGGAANTLGVEPRLDSLRSDPRFTNLVRRMGLTP